ncbi:MAG: cache domain-containing protein [Candidatus Symbiobacter sp.]|nr:cache domain-containing protein [Candidatus Symbiobacter sp.]
MACVLLGGIISSYLAYELKREADRVASETVEQAMGVAWSELRHIGTKFRIEDGKLWADNSPINGNFDIPDRVTAIMGGTATYFMGDTRVTTNVKKPDGSRAVGTKLAKNAAHHNVFEEKKPFRGVVDILGKPYITGYDPIFDDQNNVIGIVYVGYIYDEFFAHAHAIQSWSIGIIIASSLIIALISILMIQKMVGRPIRQLAAIVRSIMSQRDVAHIPFLTRQDEIGEIARACEVFSKSEAERLRIEAESAAAAKQRAALRSQEHFDMAVNLENRLAVTTRALDEMAQNLTGSAQSLAQLATQNLRDCEHANQNVMQAVERVSSVAAAVLQLSHTTTELAAESQHAVEFINTGEGQSRTASTRISTLFDASQKIDEVVGLISTIAAQTNLLALNATIEAARAGDAGRGFAVVATEVKNLAGQTATATSRITDQIHFIQNEAQAAVTAVETVARATKETTILSNNMSDAIQGQNKAANEIAKNMEETSNFVSGVNQMVMRIAKGAAETESQAENLHRIAAIITKETASLKAEISRVAQDIREG